MSECQPTTVRRIVVLLQSSVSNCWRAGSAIFTALARPVQPVLAPAAPENQHPQLAPHTPFFWCVDNKPPGLCTCGISNCAISSKPRSRASSSGVCHIYRSDAGWHRVPAITGQSLLFNPAIIKHNRFQQRCPAKWLVWLTLISVFAKSSFTILNGLFHRQASGRHRQNGLRN